MVYSNHATTVKDYIYKMIHNGSLFDPTKVESVCEGGSRTSC